MARLGKYLSLCLVAIIVVSSMLLIEYSNARATSNLSVPEFTLAYVDYSYDIPTTYTINEFTGETVATGCYHVKNMTIQVSVQNILFQNGDATSHLYYNVRFKGHYGTSWRETPAVENRTSSPSTYAKYVTVSPHNPSLLEQSSSEYTTFLFPANDYSMNDSIDFQVEAILGHDYQAWIDTDPYGEYPAHYYEAVAFDQTSGWSATHTLTIPANTLSPSPTVPEIPIIAILPLLMVIPLIAVRYGKRITTKVAPSKN